MGKQSRKRYAHEWANFPESLEFTIDRLQRVSIENMDGLTLIKKYDSPQALFYIDPPYLQSTRNSSGKNYRFEFGVSEHVALSGLLHGMQGKAVISGYQSSLYEDLYADWRRVGAVSRKEVLWMNYEANP
jgi:DNA adenine methylase